MNTSQEMKRTPMFLTKTCEINLKDNLKDTHFLEHGERTWLYFTTVHKLFFKLIYHLASRTDPKFEGYTALLVMSVVLATGELVTLKSCCVIRMT